jgi:hypothetical protein
MMAARNPTQPRRCRMSAWCRLLALLAALFAVWACPDGAFQLAMCGAIVGTAAFADPGGEIDAWPIVVEDDAGDLEAESI